MYELTRSQKAIYELEKFCGGSIANIGGNFMFDESVDIASAKNIINEIYRLNDALRIRIKESDSKVYQYFCDYEWQDIEVLHFDSHTQLDNFCKEYNKEPMDLSGSLCDIKITVVNGRIGAMCKLHHIICDAWTLALLISAGLNMLTEGNTPKAYSYLNHIEKEAGYRKSSRFEKDRLFFEERFKSCDEILFLNEKHTDILTSKRETFVLGSDMLKKINDYASRNESSVFAVLLTALAVYINRIKMNAEKFYIGTTVLNRAGVVEKNTMGMFINTIAILVELDNNETFSNNLSRVSESAFSSFRHEKYNYSELLENLHRNFGFNDKLYDVMFSYQNAKLFGGMGETTWVSNGMQTESLQIHVDDRDDKGTLTVHYDYLTEKFTKQEIHRLHKQLFSILSDALENEDKKICQLNFFEQSENLYSTLIGEETKLPENETIYSLFEKNAEKNKDKICISTAEGSVTYGQFLKYVQRLDMKIRKLTSGKKQPIAIIADRSIEMYLSIYAAIRGGNAYLPLSPGFPKERTDYILKNAGAQIVLAQKEYASVVPGEKTIDVSAFLKEEITGEPEPLPSSATAPDTAYIIYTSGSTGNPKGAKISNLSAINRILWMQKMYPLEENSVILQKTPYTFDVSVWEIFWWGMCPGMLAVSKKDEHFIPAKILEDTKRYNVTHLHFVPSVFELFLDYLESNQNECEKFESVKHVFLSGEALSAELIKRFYKLFSENKVSLHNLYGPTECAVDVTYYDCTAEEADPVPIGKPIDNTSVYIVDKYLNRVADCVKGELCIGGINVGQGYVNNPLLTEEKFVDNPFGEGKLYKTGDYAFIRDDGQIIFCGRIDGQIKLGGQRIETGEIEAVISKIEEIDSVCVVIRKESGHDILVAFYCGEKIEETKIKAVCASKLPGYMIPSIFCHIQNMPLNRSGKLDRKALREIEIEKSYEDTENDEPQNETERRICEIFSEVCGGVRIGRNTDFVSAGGSSIDMISVLSKDEFKDITASDFISNSTPAMLARLIEKRKKQKYVYLHTLKKAKNSQKALIIFPFAGGAAESFAVFSNSLAKADKNLSIYYVDFLSTQKQLFEAAKEIENLSKETEISFYSHCAGSAVAMKLLEIFEGQSIAPVSRYIACANIPPQKASDNFWNKVSDKLLKKLLTFAGADISKLDDDALKSILLKFREDTDFFFETFSSFKKPISCKLSVIISKQDLFTLNHKSARKAWLKYVTGLEEIRYIKSRSHYFQSEKSDELAQMIKQIISK